MGSTIKICTKRGEEAYVHELSLAADVLEQRYRNQEVGPATGSIRERCWGNGLADAECGGWHCVDASLHEHLAAHPAVKSVAAEGCGS